jgi:hypothetical protein
MALTQVPGTMMVSASVTPTQLNTQSQYTGFKNRIINGAMVIDQRNAGASITPSTNLTYSLDRWVAGMTNASLYSVQQNAGSVTPPTGFANYLGVTTVSAYVVAAGEVMSIQQRIEGFNMADFAWGTANAKTVTLSFQVYSSLTGTFGGSIKNSASNRTYPFSYSVSVANTWTAVSITIPGDTTGTWLTTNGVGLILSYSLGCGTTFSTTGGAWVAGNYVSVTGAVSIVATLGATLYITGVQLEVGSTATSFDYRPYGTELVLCQRYYEVMNSSLDAAFNTSVTSTNYATWLFKVEKRSTPTITQSGLNITAVQSAQTGGVEWYGPSSSLLRISTATAAAEL